MADPINWPLGRPLDKLECFSSFKEYFGDEIDGWSIKQFKGNSAYTYAYYTDGPTRNAPSLFFRKINKKQCLIVQVPFSDANKIKFSPDGTLAEVSASEIPGGAVDTGPYKQIVFKPGKDHFFIPSECKLNYFMDVASLSYPCNGDPNFDSVEEPYNYITFPSFDCGKINSEIENLICKEQQIAVLDSIFSLNYKHIVSRLADGRAPVVAEQKAWIKQRNACKTKECLTEAYQTRMHNLCTKYSSLFGRSDSGVLYNCVTLDQ